MKRKIILNVILSVLALFSIAALIVLCIFLNEIKSSPQFLVHTIDYLASLQYYEVQDKLIAYWEKLCTIALVFIIIVISTIFLIIGLFNYFSAKSPNTQVERNLKKQARIEKLQAELEELKKD